MADADKRERLEEEFELGDEAEAIEEYSYITSVIAVNYSLMADELSKLLSSQEGLGLDLGCGLGDLAIEVGRRYSRMDITGIDISPEALARATVIIHNVREGTAADTKAVEAFCRARNPHAQLHAVNLADTAATSQVLGPILSSAGFR